MACVFKTAPFGTDRRIGAAFIGTRENDQDRGAMQWAGNVVLRELVQHPNGTLGVKFPPEAIPLAGAPLVPQAETLTGSAVATVDRVTLASTETMEAASFSGIPRNARITCRVSPGGGAGPFGLRLRCAAHFGAGYDLQFHPSEKRVTLNDQSLLGIEGLDRAFSLDVILQEDIIDVCLDQRHCLIDRCPELDGEHLTFFAQGSGLTFGEIEIRPLAAAG